MEINALVSNSNLKPAQTNPLFAAPKQRAELTKEVAPQATNGENDLNIQEQQVKDLSEAEKTRYDNVRKAVQTKSARNYFVVGDSTFTIFKDSSGQFITRFTSLRDGKVTYIPELAVLDFMQHTADQRAALIEVEA